MRLQSPRLGAILMHDLDCVTDPNVLKVIKTLLILLPLVISGGCVVGTFTPPTAPAPAPIEVQGFDAAEVAYIHDVGTNRIEGNAFLRKRGGDVVTCAGEAVRLVPLGRFAKKYFRIRYIEKKPAALDVWDAPAFHDHVRTTRCESDGRFLFTRVAAGSYFIETKVSWHVYDLGSQGGDIGYALRVRSDGTTDRVVMSGDDVGPHWEALLAE